MLPGAAIKNTLRELGIIKIEIIPWELDRGELGVSIEWASGQYSAFPVSALGDIKRRLCAQASAASS